MCIITLMVFIKTRGEGDGGEAAARAGMENKAAVDLARKRCR